jgi:hypothetical protein
MMAPRTCPECGGRIEYSSKPGRQYRYHNDLVTISDELKLPTCNGCGEEYLNAELCTLLDRELRNVWVPVQIARIHELVEALERDEALRIAVVADVRATLGHERYERFLARLRPDLADPWPPRDVVEQLVQATEHLLDDHSCDQHGYESWRIAAKKAREHFEK